MGHESGDAVHIRNWGRTITGLAGTLVIAGFFSIGWTTDPTQDTVIGVTIIEVLALIALVRTWRAGAVVTADRVVIRNLIRSYSIPWSDVTAFSPAWDDPRHHTVGVETASGRRVSCKALRSMGGWGVLSAPQHHENAAVNRAASRFAVEVDRMLDLRQPAPPRTGASATRAGGPG
jgi:hypothetical protein